MSGLTSSAMINTMLGRRFGASALTVLPDDSQAQKIASSNTAVSIFVALMIFNLECNEV
jgi:hypothetical protein